MSVEIYANLTGVNISSDVVNFGSRREVTSWQKAFTGAILSPIIVLGILGNIFSLLVWIKGRRRKTSTARYLSALAVADILVLLFCAVEFWIGYVLEYDVRTSGTYACKFFFFLSFLFPVLSAWILVCVTVERALSVWIPHRINVACTPVKAVVVIFATAFVLFLTYFPIFTGAGIVTVYSRGSSYITCSLQTTALIRDYFIVWIILDLCLFFLVPIVLMLVCNISILTKVVWLANKRRSHLQGDGKSKTVSISGKNKKMLKTVTRRVIILTITYCICNAPISILNVILISGNADDSLQELDVQIYRIIFNILMYLNNGVNFLLYCLIGSGFRKDFMGIFKSGSRSSSS